MSISVFPFETFSEQAIYFSASKILTLNICEKHLKAHLFIYMYLFLLNKPQTNCKLRTNTPFSRAAHENKKNSEGGGTHGRDKQNKQIVKIVKS